MEKFSMPFLFGDTHYLADVAVIHGKDHIQYSISPRDKDLLAKYSTQVVHVFPEKSLEPAFSGLSEERSAFTKALTDALRHHLEKRSDI